VKFKGMGGGVCRKVRGREGERAEGCGRVKCKKMMRESAREYYKTTRAGRGRVEQG
jgi:hypothetical protein